MASSTAASGAPATTGTSTQSAISPAVATSAPVALPTTPWVTPGYTLLEAVMSTATSTSIDISCDSAYTADLYDTPTGHLDSGYVLATSSADTEPNIAHLIGSQSWADCHDALGNVYEIKLTPEQYAALGQPGATMPKESLTLASQSPVGSAPVITDINSSGPDAGPATTASTTQSMANATTTVGTTTPSN
jgi:hypothetical protein